MKTRKTFLDVVREAIARVDEEERKDPFALTKLEVQMNREMYFLSKHKC